MVDCWSVFYHGRQLNRLLEVCSRSLSLLGRVCLPGGEHVSQSTPIILHEGSTSAFVFLAEPRHALKPCRGTRIARERTFSLHLVLDTARSILLIDNSAASRPSFLMKLFFRCNILVCARGGHVDISGELGPPRVPISTAAMKVPGADGVSRVQKVACSCCCHQFYIFPLFCNVSDLFSSVCCRHRAPTLLHIDTLHSPRVRSTAIL